MHTVRALACSAALIALVLTQPSTSACEPVRLSLEFSKSSPSRVGQVIDLKIKLSDQNDRSCAGSHDYPIHLEVTAGKVIVSQRDIRIPTGHTEPDAKDCKVTLTAPGIITAHVSSKGLRDGVASVLVYAEAPVEPEPRLKPWRGLLILATYPQNGQESSASSAGQVFAYCSTAGQVTANGREAITVTADYQENGNPGQAPEEISLVLPHGSLDWDGAIKIQRSAFSGSAEVRSKHIGHVAIGPLISSFPANIRFRNDPDSCKTAEFISAAHYADLELESHRIALGEAASLWVSFQDIEHDPVLIESATSVFASVMAGRSGHFSDPVLKDGKVTMVFKPQLWGDSQIVIPGMSTISTNGTSWKEGPVSLHIDFPYVALSVSLVGGCFGGFLAALYRKETKGKDLLGRLAFGVAAALLLVCMAVGGTLLTAEFQANVFLFIPLAMAGGCSGPGAFQWFAKKYGFGAPPEGPLGRNVAGASSN